MASLLAKEALSESGVAKMRSNVQLLVSQRLVLLAAFKTVPYFGKILGSNDANFILVEIVSTKPDNELAVKIYRALAEQEGVVVRYRGIEHGCEGCVRITVGTKEENEVLVSKLMGKTLMDIVEAHNI